MKPSIALFLFLLTRAGLGFGAERYVTVPPETPFFKEPTTDSGILQVATKTLSFEIQETRRVYLAKNPFVVAAGRTWHPLMAYADFFRVSVTDEKDAWVSRDLKYYEEGKIVIPWRDPDYLYLYLSWATVAATAFLACWGFTRGQLFDIVRLSAGPLLRPRVVAAALAMLILIRYALFFNTLSMCGKTIIYPTDEHHYFEVAIGLIHGRIADNWRYTIGLPLLYVPFVVISRALNYFDVQFLLSFFNSLVLQPTCCLLVFLVLQKATRSSRTALLTVALLTVLPFIYFPVEHHVINGGKGLFKAVFGLPELNSASYRLYYLFLSNGHNGMSDMPSALLILLCIALGLYLRPGTKLLTIVSALFGFACLVRINNILFAPLVAYVFWIRMRSVLDTPTSIGKSVTIAVTSFVVVFSPQFVVNWMQFGSPFIFPYVLHGSNAAEGFNFHRLRTGIPFLIGCNYIYMSAGAFGLLFTRDIKKVALTGLWSVPLILYFCGYEVLCASPVRFILPAYAGLLGAFAGSDFWRALSPTQKFPVSVICAASFLLVSPCARFLPPYMWSLEEFPMGILIAKILMLAVPLGSVLAAALLFSSDRRLLLTMLAFLGIYHSGSPFLIVGVFLMVLVRIAWWWFRDVCSCVTLFDVSTRNPREDSGNRG